MVHRRLMAQEWESADENLEEGEGAKQLVMEMLLSVMQAPMVSCAQALL